MDTVIAVIIIGIAALFVFNKVRKQFDSRNGGGCGCSGGCSGGSESGSCCQAQPQKRPRDQ